MTIIYINHRIAKFVYKRICNNNFLYTSFCTLLLHKIIDFIEVDKRIVFREV